MAAKGSRAFFFNEASGERWGIVHVPRMEIRDGRAGPFNFKLSKRRYVSPIIVELDLSKTGAGDAAQLAAIGQLLRHSGSRIILSVYRADEALFTAEADAAIDPPAGAAFSLTGVTMRRTEGTGESIAVLNVALGEAGELLLSGQDGKPIPFDPPPHTTGE